MVLPLVAAAGLGVKKLIDGTQGDQAQIEAENAALVPKTTAEQKANIDSFQQGSNLSQQQLTDQGLQGTAEAGSGLLPSTESLQREAGTLGMAQDPMMSEALNRRASSFYNRAQSNLKRDAKSKAPMERFSRLQEGAQLAQEQSNLAAQIRDAQYQRYTDQKNRRAGVLKSLLGVAGQIGGSVIGALTGGGMGGGIPTPGAGAGPK